MHNVVVAVGSIAFVIVFLGVALLIPKFEKAPWFQLPENETLLRSDPAVLMLPELPQIWGYLYLTNERLIWAERKGDHGRVAQVIRLLAGRSGIETDFATGLESVLSVAVVSDWFIGRLLTVRLPGQTLTFRLSMGVYQFTLPKVWAAAIEAARSNWRRELFLRGRSSEPPAEAFHLVGPTQLRNYRFEFAFMSLHVVVGFILLRGHFDLYSIALALLIEVIPVTRMMIMLRRRQRSKRSRDGA